MRTITFLICLFMVPGAFAQKKQLLEDKEIILHSAAAELDSLLLPGTRIHEQVIKEGLIGKYLLRVSFREKGDVSSVFVVSASDHDIRSQNRFKDLIHQHRFNFKLPKGRHYRIEHEFDLDKLHHQTPTS